jgi:hypothetical protein
MGCTKVSAIRSPGERTLSKRHSSSAFMHLPVTEPGSPRPQQPSGSSSGPTSSTTARMASAAARRTAQSWDARQPRMPLALKGLPLTVMIELAVLPPPLLGPTHSLFEFAEVRRCCCGCPIRWFM